MYNKLWWGVITGIVVLYLVSLMTLALTTSTTTYRDDYTIQLMEVNK